jgi:excisionase family DNA binding protein
VSIEKGGKTYLTAKETYTMLGVTRQTLNSLIAGGKLHAYKLGVTKLIYFEKQEVEKLTEIRPAYDDK